MIRHKALAPMIAALLLGAILGGWLFASSRAGAAHAAESAASLATPASPVALGAWSVFPGPVTNTLRSVALASATEGWIAGWGRAGEHGPVLYWDGNAWQVATSLPCGDPEYGCTEYYAAAALPSGDAWVTAGGTIPHYSDIPWSAVDHWQHSLVTERLCDLRPRLPLRGVSALSATDVWAAGANMVVHWNGSLCTTTMTPNGTFLHSLDMVSAADGWAVGYRSYASSEYGPAAFHWDGANWIDAGLTGASGRALNSVVMLSSANGWAVGDDGLILRWDGAHWTETATPTSVSLHSVTLVSAADGWAVGDAGAILHYDGSAWQKVSSPTTANLNAIAMTSANDGWIVGDGGIILHYAVAAPITALRAGARPIVDGDIGEWSGLDATFLNRTNAATLVGDVPTTTDLSLRLRAAWTPETLYLSVTIWDDALVGNDSAHIWDDDTLELGFYDPATGRSHQFSLAVDGRQADQGIPITSLTVATRTIPGGWNVEVAVPVAVLGTGPLAAGQQYPFTFGYWDDDLDHGGPGQTHMIWLGTSTYAYQPAWGALKLSATTHDFIQPSSTATPTTTSTATRTVTPTATATASRTATPTATATRTPTVTLTPTASATPLLGRGDLVGRAWLDVDGDGMIDAGEAGLSGVEIRLLRNGIFARATTTAGDGSYAFTGLSPDTYTVRESHPAGLRYSSTPDQVTIALAAGQVRTVNFGDWNGRPAWLPLILR